MNRTHKVSFRVSDYEHKLVQSRSKYQVSECPISAVMLKFTIS
nr:hypothetical protein [uncultured Clostridium sp.]